MTFLLFCLFALVFGGNASPTPAPAPQPIGSSCSTNMNCISGVCGTKPQEQHGDIWTLCLGAATLGATCTFSEDCALDYWCGYEPSTYASTCKATVSKNGNCAGMSDTACAAGLFCLDKTFTCSTLRGENDACTSGGECSSRNCDIAKGVCGKSSGEIFGAALSGVVTTIATIYIIIIVVIVISVLLCIGCCVYCCMKQNRQNKVIMANQAGAQVQPGQQQPQHVAVAIPIQSQQMQAQPMQAQQPMMGQPMMGQPMQGQPMQGQPMTQQPIQQQAWTTPQ